MGDALPAQGYPGVGRGKWGIEGMEEAGVGVTQRKLWAAEGLRG